MNVQSKITEWVVVYWTPARQEKRFETEKEAFRYTMNLPSRAKVFIDEVYIGEAAHVR